MNVVAGWLITLSTVTQGPIPVLQGRIDARRVVDSARTTIVVSTLATVLFVLIVGWRDELAFDLPSHVSAVANWCARGAGVLYAIANVLLFVSAPIVGSTQFGMAFTLRVVPIAGLSPYLVGEKFTGWKLLGIVLVVGFVLRSYAIRGRSAVATEVETFTKRDKALAWSALVIGTLCFGTANALDARVVKEVNAITYLPLRLMLPVAVIAVSLLVWAMVPTRFKPRSKVNLSKRPRTRLRDRKREIILLSVFMPVSAASFMQAVQLTGQTTVLASIHQLSLFVTLALGAWLKGGNEAIDETQPYAVRLRAWIRGGAQGGFHELRYYVVPAAGCIPGVALSLGVTPNMFISLF